MELEEREIVLLELREKYQLFERLVNQANEEQLGECVDFLFASINEVMKRYKLEQLYYMFMKLIAQFGGKNKHFLIDSINNFLIDLNLEKETLKNLKKNLVNIQNSREKMPLLVLLLGLMNFNFTLRSKMLYDDIVLLESANKKIQYTMGNDNKEYYDGIKKFNTRLLKKIKK